ncbi:hypothetical protein TWF730_010110 [Orbilia blumenaviensis]|uniref:AAA+ ATPase domain-containing protein n=1 Tax=Orbilia blumenaviensis TaxID=1796055 RepID=A0AAV9UV55_9PEZI
MMLTKKDILNKLPSDIDRRPPANESLNYLEETDYIAQLQERISQLESQIEKKQGDSSVEQQKLYRIFCGREASKVYLDKPRVRDNSNDTPHYEADIPLPDVTGYLERHFHIHFVAYQDFECCKWYPTFASGDSSYYPRSARDKDSDWDSDSDSEDDTPRRDVKIEQRSGPKSHFLPRHPALRNPFVIVSTELKDLVTVLQAKLKITALMPGFESYKPIEGPHTYILRNIGQIRNEISTFSPRQQYLLKIVFNYVVETFGAEFYKATKLFNQGLVSRNSICYLIAAGDIVVTEDKAHRLRAYIINKSPETNYEKLSVKGWSWKFNGSFQKSDVSLTIVLSDVFQNSEVVEIKTLGYYPLIYAELGSRSFLKNRGLEFWRCRHRRFVSYSGQDADNNDNFVNVRFMVDTMTYRKMHPQSALAKESLVDDLGSAMEDDSPLEENQMLIFPPTIFGFHVLEKKWYNLRVDNIRDVAWNKAAFDSLVVDENTKLLIVALVSNKIAADAGTDLMNNKGNGLIILLHGAPGTGKTLTAGSVAEHAEKPLYRVTTGDIGTDPEAVEKYLTSVLYLGKIWGCVVLLDEADVFLEERTLSDLQRNALVSVFLRVLEYYDGILILTSNRVGTFDSAFKSRIQLAIHYDNLDRDQRVKIWKSFIKRLEDVAFDDIDTDELNQEKNIRKLAAHKLNGRQIRNNITTARQLALYKKEPMSMSHLETVMQVSNKFDDYLRGVKSGLDDEEIARENGER